MVRRSGFLLAILLAVCVAAGSSAAAAPAPGKVKAAGWRATFADATAAAETLSGEHRVGLLAQIAAAQAHAGDRDSARATLARATAVPIAPLPNGYVSPYPTRLLAVAHARVGSVSEALDTARRVTRAYERALTLAEVGAALREAGRTDAAQTAFEQARAAALAATGAGEGEWRISALIQVAAVQRGARLPQPALATLQEAARVARQKDDALQKAADLATLAPIFAQFGDPEAAGALYVESREAAARIPDAGLHLQWVDAALAAGELNAAQELARSLRGRQSWTALSRVAEAAAKARDRPRAETLFGEATAAARLLPAEERAYTLALVALSRARAGYLQPARELLREAVSLARGLADPLTRADALTLVGEGWFRTDRKPQAVEALREALEAERRVNWAEVQGIRALPDPAGTLLAGLARAGDFTAAEAAARAVPDPDSRAAHLERLTQELVAAGRLDQALQVARKIEIPEHQARSLLAVAAAQAKARH